MSSKSHAFRTLLLGIAVALIAAGAIAPRFLNIDGRIPLDLQSSSWTMVDGEGFAKVPTGEGEEDYQGPMALRYHLNLQDPADRDTVTAGIGRSLMKGADGEGEGADVNNLIKASVWNFPMDRLTGQADGPAQLNNSIAAPNTEVEMGGYWLKFPSQAKKTTYPVFDPTLRAARDAVFEEELEMEGRKVYHYRQEIPPENVAQLYADFGNTGQLPTEDGGTETGYLNHAAYRDFYVDQISGLVVGMSETIDDFMADREGNRRHDVLRFTGTTSEENTAAMLQAAEQVINPAIAQIVRWSVIGLGVLLALICLFGIIRNKGSRPQRSQKKAQPAQDLTPPAPAPSPAKPEGDQEERPRQVFPQNRPD